MPLCCCKDENNSTVDKIPDTIETGEVVLKRCAPPVLTRDDFVEVQVHVNVYSLLKRNDCFKKIGMGVFHCGIVVYGIEWGYGECMDPNTASGLFCVCPGHAAGSLYRTICLGVTTRSPEQVDTILHRLENEWRSADYHILAHNCNHFAQRFCDMLSTVQKLQLPAWCNRAARVCNKVVPRRLASYIHRMMDEPPPKATPAAPSRVRELPTSVIPPLWYNYYCVSKNPRYVTIQNTESERLFFMRENGDTPQDKKRFGVQQPRVPKTRAVVPKISIVRRGGVGVAEWSTLREGSAPPPAPKRRGTNVTDSLAMKDKSNRVCDGESSSASDSEPSGVLDKHSTSVRVVDSLRYIRGGSVSGANTDRRAPSGSSKETPGDRIDPEESDDEDDALYSSEDGATIRIERKLETGSSRTYTSSTPTDEHRAFEGGVVLPNAVLASDFSSAEASLNDARECREGFNGAEQLMRSNDTVSHVIHVHHGKILRSVNQSQTRDSVGQTSFVDSARGVTAIKTIAPSLTVTSISQAYGSGDRTRNEISRSSIGMHGSSCGLGDLSLPSTRRCGEGSDLPDGGVVGFSSAPASRAMCNDSVTVELQHEENGDLYSDPGGGRIAGVDSSLFHTSVSSTKGGSLSNNLPNPLLALNKRLGPHMRTYSSPF